jgi:NAD(P)-dependent dehydrogenase (short-subunit alcohol dehydrogenase family)
VTNSGERGHRVALVTGASRGIGRCAALALARRGFDVAIAARTLHEGQGVSDVAVPGSLDTTAAEIAALGGSALPIVLDLLDRASIEAAVETVQATWGRVDALVNNGIYQGAGTNDLFLDLTLADAERIVVGNYVNQLMLTQLVLPSMLASGGGTIVNMVSASATTDPPAPAGKGGWGVGYAASKAAMGRMAGVLKAEFGDRGVLAVNVDPGFVVTERMKARNSTAAYASHFRGAPPEVPGEVIGWLCDDPAGADFAGRTVYAQKLCKELGLVPGWPPPRPDQSTNADVRSKA